MSNTPMPQYGIEADYPLLYAMAMEFDFAQRLGGSGSPLHDEVDEVLREVWMARREKASDA